MLTDQQSDFYIRPLLEISLELLSEIEFERGMVITIGRSVLGLWERFQVLYFGIYLCTVQAQFLRTLRETKITSRNWELEGMISEAKSILREEHSGLSHQSSEFKIFN